MQCTWVHIAEFREVSAWETLSTISSPIPFWYQGLCVGNYFPTTSNVAFETE